MLIPLWQPKVYREYISSLLLKPLLWIWKLMMEQQSCFDIIFSDILLRRTILITSFVWQWWEELTMQGINKMVIITTKFIHFIINKISQVLTMSPILTTWLLALQPSVRASKWTHTRNDRLTMKRQNKASKQTKTFKTYNLKGLSVNV